MSTVVEYVTATISSGSALSDEINLKGKALVGLIMPSAWTTANITFQAGYGSSPTYNDVYDQDGGEITIIAAASQQIMIDPSFSLALEDVKVRSGTTGTPVNQGADREVVLIITRLSG